MEIQCPECGKTLKVDDSAASQQASCPHCRHEFVPSDAAAEPEQKDERLALEGDEGKAAPQAAPAAGPPPLKPAARAPAAEAPPAEGGPPGPPSLKGKVPPAPSPLPLNKPLLIGLGVASSLVMLLIVIALLKAIFAGGGAGVADFAAYIPKEAAFVSYFNVAALRDSGIFEALGRDAGEVRRELPGGLQELNLEENDLADVFVTGVPHRDPIVVVRTTRELDLADMAEEAGEEVQSHEGVQYTQAGTGYRRMWVANTGRHTYCVADSEDRIKQIIQQLTAKQKSALSDELQRVLREVQGEQHYIVGVTEDAFAGTSAGGVGFTVDSRIRAKAALLFTSSDKAKEFENMAADGLKSLIERWHERLEHAGDEDRKAIELTLDILRGVDVERSGEMVYLSAGCKVKDISQIAEAGPGDLVDMVEDLIMEMMGEMH